MKEIMKKDELYNLASETRKNMDEIGAVMDFIKIQLKSLKKQYGEHQRKFNEEFDKHIQLTDEIKKREETWFPRKEV